VRRHLAAAALLLLAACPLPQPLPVVQRTNGTTVTPPRVIAESATPAQALIRVGDACPSTSTVAFSALLDDPNVDDAVQARWFVDYDAGAHGVLGIEDVAAAADPSNPIRSLAAPFVYRITDHAPAQPHVVELVVSNGFYGLGGDPLGSPVNRTAQPGFEAQVFRWIVLHEAGGPCP
jgi:hypothetical protein